MKRDKSISFLIGAGFSAPMGYPLGKGLNELLLQSSANKFRFHSSGQLMVADNKETNSNYKTSYDLEFDFCRDLMHYFNQKKGYFDYEEFYDFYKIEAKDDSGLIKLFRKGNYGYQDLSQLLFATNNIYNQLVSYYLVDKNKNAWYDNTGHMMGPVCPGYTGILNCFKILGSEYIILIHSLSHDLLFERLNISDWFKGELCDGASENSKGQRPRTS